ncbi:MAG: LysE family transporter [Ignavibacteria bacterium]|nr:LysE family transporter [Ignavibacteria bacterium]
MFEFISVGIVLGLSAGYSPGPLNALIVSETLKKNVKAGVKAALAPAITDLPIILISFYLLFQLKNYSALLGIIAIIGAILVILYGVKELTVKDVELNQTESSSSLKKAVLVNFLSPHPYIFWISIAGPIIQKAYGISFLHAIIFIISFYVFLVGSKMSIAVISQKSKKFLKGNGYKNVIKILGAVLIILGLLLLRDGLTRMQII